MAWGGKVVGATAGAVFGGPLGAAVGAGLGAVWDGFFSDDPNTMLDVDSKRTFPVSFTEVRYETVVTKHGPGIRWVAVFESDRSISGEAVLVVRLKQAGTYIHSDSNDYRDSDGDFITCGPVEFDHRRTAGAGVALHPNVALKSWPREVEAELQLYQGERELIGVTNASFDFPTQTEFEDSSVMGALIYACIGLVCSDGPLERSEVRYLRDYMKHVFELEDDGDHILRQMMKRARDKASSPEAAATRLRPHWSDGISEPVLKMLYAIADADGIVSRVEEEWIARFCAALGISLDDRANVKHSHAAELEEYRTLLKVDAGASKNEIKRAFRREAADYHPDKVANLPSGFQEFANERMRKLNDAYQVLYSQAEQ